MQDAPKPGSPFYGAYEIALDWCDDLPEGELHDSCVVGSIASLGMWEQVAADRATFLQGALICLLVAGVVVLAGRRLRRA